jgi:hypothetical protein
METPPIENKEVNYLLYYSVLNTDVPQERIDEIFQKSFNNNQENGLTGALIFQNNKFMGYIEGDRDKLENTFKRISRDDRHQFLKILVSGKHKEPLFSEWRSFWKPTDERCIDDMRALNLDENFEPHSYIMALKRNFIRELLLAFYENKSLEFENFWKQ